ncbi:MAG: VCBS domain-containing protein [Sedimenticola sp.]|nr:VCBS domain-containing protein [Sedimenticola sp.]
MTDIHGDTQAGTPSLDILISDTAPTANADARTVNEDDTGIVGNVVTGSNATADTLGADAATVTGLATGTAAGEVSGNVGGSGVTGTYGTLIINSDGSYSYVTNAAAQLLRNGDSVTDTFSYTLKDSDGDFSTTTVTFTVTGSNDAPVASATVNVVDEAALTAGTDPLSTAETVSGSLNFVSGDGIGSIVVNGSTVSSGGLTLNGTYGDLTIQTDGSYTYVLNSAGTHPLTGQTGSSDQINEVFNYTVFDPDGESDNSTLTININDDGPVATNVATTVDEVNLNQTFNLVIVFDRSGSMADNPGVPGYSSRIDLARASLNNMFNKFSQLGDVNIMVVDFAGNASSSDGYANTVSGAWFGGANSNTDTVSHAMTYLNSLNASGGTGYGFGLDQTRADYSAPPPATTGHDVHDLVYFVSDGEHNTGTYNATTISNWEAFNTNNGIEKTYAIGVGEGINTAAVTNLDGVAFPNNDPANPIVILDDNKLIDSMENTVSGSTITGDVIGDVSSGLNVQFGADGGYIQSIEIDGHTYLYTSGSPGSITKDGSAFISGNEMVVETAIGGTLTFDFVAGTYTYSTGFVSQNETEIFTFTAIDNDGDTASANLQINITNVLNDPTAADDLVVTNIIGGDTIAIPDWALLHNDEDTLGGDVSVNAVSSPSAGTVTHDATNLVVNLDNSGDSTFDYNVSSGADVSSNAQVTVDRQTGSTVSGSNANEILIGTDGNDTLSSSGGNDILIGGAGDDILNSQGGGGSSNLLNGGTGADTYNDATGTSSTVVLRYDDLDGNVDTTNSNFDLDAAVSATYKDYIDISDVLQGAGYTSDKDIHDYLNISNATGTPTLQVDVSGTGTSFQSVLQMNGDSYANLDALLATGALILE